MSSSKSNLSLDEFLLRPQILKLRTAGRTNSQIRKELSKQGIEVKRIRKELAAIGGRSR